MEYGEITDCRSCVVVNDCKFRDFRFDRLVQYTRSVKMACRQSAILSCCVQKCIFWCVSNGLSTRGLWSLCSVYWSRYQPTLWRYV